MSDDPLKILLVEDSDDDAELLRLALKKTNFQIERADRLSVALEKLEAGPFDAILLDLSLPDCQGFETFSKIRSGAQRTINPTHGHCRKIQKVRHRNRRR